jgi:UDP-3-O-acyl-N-acetylglucosamine deacetylase
MQGDLALLAVGGSQGLPIGHIVSFNADHALHVTFAKALRDACTDADYIDWHKPEEVSMNEES